MRGGIVRCGIFSSYFLLMAVEAIPITATPTSLTFPTSYIAQGIINTPDPDDEDDKVREPFQAWYDGKNQRSRIDYHNGNDKTYQLGPENKTLLISPTVGDTTNASCYATDDPAKPQPVLPYNLTGFKYIGEDDFEGIPCYVFRMQATIGKKVNTYTLTVEQKTSAPKRYEMRGYDTLLGSHYDKYEILYTMFNATTLSDDIFEVPKGMTCHGMPVPGMESNIRVNPMRDFFDPIGEDRVHEAFKEFIKKYKRKYGEKDYAEFERRKGYYRNTLRWIHSQNRENKEALYAINFLADYKDAEEYFGGC